MTDLIQVRVHALSEADALGYLGQQAVDAAMADSADYRIIGGHMVRMLLHVYPTAAATQRSTLDADAAVGDVEVVAPFAESLLAQDFTKEGGNVFAKSTGGGQPIEVNLLLARTGSRPGLARQAVDGVGQVDTLPELSFAMGQDPLILNVTADLGDRRILQYQTRIPDLESAVILKAHSWKGRRKAKDLADLHSLLEIREAHPDIPWRLHEQDLTGRRKDTARILHPLAGTLTKKVRDFEVPGQINPLRMAALLQKHIGSVR